MKNIIWRGGRALELRKVTTRKIKKCLWEIELFLMTYEGGRGDPSSAGSYLAELALAERSFRAFAAELRRRGRARPGVDGGGAGRGSRA